MITNPRNLLWILPLALFAASPLWQPPVAAFLTPRGGYNPKLALPPEESPVQNFTMDSVAITMTKNGMEEWQIDAEQAFTGDKGNQIDMERVSAMYIGNEREPINIVSRKGMYDLNKRRLVLTEQVRVTKPTKDQVLLSDRLEYDDATRTLVSPGKVTIKAPGMQLQAGRMDYDFATEGYDFTNRVRVDL